MGRVEGHGVPRPPHPPAAVHQTGAVIGEVQCFPRAYLRREGHRWSIWVQEPGARSRPLVDLIALDLTWATAEALLAALRGAPAAPVGDAGDTVPTARLVALWDAVRAWAVDTQSGAGPSITVLGGILGDHDPHAPSEGGPAARTVDVDGVRPLTVSPQDAAADSALIAVQEVVARAMHQAMAAVASRRVHSAWDRETEGHRSEVRRLAHPHAVEIVALLRPS
jgi:hypothetical protein